MHSPEAIDKEMNPFFSLYEKEIDKETLGREINRFLVELRKRNPKAYTEITSFGDRTDVLQDYKNDFIKLCMFVYFYPFEVRAENIQFDTEMLIGNGLKGVDLIINCEGKCKDIVGLVHGDHEEILEFVSEGHPVLSIAADLDALEGNAYEVVHEKFLNEDMYLILSKETFEQLNQQKGTPLWFNLML